jgi:hypothetical protein
MDTVAPRDPTLEQKRMFYQLLLTMVVAAVVSSALHKPSVIFTMFIVSWTLAIFWMGRLGYWPITRGVVAMGVLMYVIVRFIIPDWPS